MKKITLEVYGKRKITPKSKSWWTTKLSRLRKTARKYERKYYKTRKEQDY